MTLNVGARIRGAYFRVEANFREPCGIPCPVTDAVPEPQIPIEFMLDTSLNPVSITPKLKVKELSSQKQFAYF